MSFRDKGCISVRKLTLIVVVVSTTANCDFFLKIAIVLLLNTNLIFLLQLTNLL